MVTEKRKLLELRERLTQVVRGADDAAVSLCVAMLSRGHVLIEGPPGIGKTSIATALAEAITGSCKRVQFTPDLLPSDILGYNFYRQDIGEFSFVKGPVFTNILLADEINRTSPRVQSALLESMSEAQVSVDGVSHNLEQPFMVLATQNDMSYTGTFPLPEPQLDRFLLVIPMSLPPRSVQVEILMKQKGSTAESSPIFTQEEVLAMQSEVDEVKASEELASYTVDLCEAVRERAGGAHTVSVRASLSLLKAARAYAYMEGAEHVLPEHIQKMFLPVMTHRVLCDDGSESFTAIEAALESVPVP